MPRWVSTAIAIALWPVAMTLGMVLVSSPILALYDAGSLGSSPVAPMTFISIGAIVVSVGLCIALRAVLLAATRYAEHRPSHPRHAL